MNSKPDWSAPPGVVLREWLEQRNISQREMARRMGRSYHTVNLVCTGHRGISAEFALDLERATGVPAERWVEIDGRHKLHLARQARGAA